ncbi:hypothetical protein CASFOL_001557 [Castilleja foliolosa]|uniref:Uncharacterized protein n=1 Tax=Castilleja foliolosa TaxID=1961234 RepID=A0ABD3EJH7_9LAMI
MRSLEEIRQRLKFMGCKEFHLMFWPLIMERKKEEETPSKAAKVNLPTSQFVGCVMPGSVGLGYPPPPNFGQMPPLYNPIIPMPQAGWQVPPRPQHWNAQHHTPLFPVHNVRHPAVSATHVLPLFHVVPNYNIPPQSSPFSALVPPMSLLSGSSTEIKSVERHFGGTMPINNYQTPGIPENGPSIGPPPVIANKAPTTQSATNEVYLVWDNEAMSMVRRKKNILVEISGAQ